MVTAGSILGSGGAFGVGRLLEERRIGCDDDQADHFSAVALSKSAAF
jgi:hypothetical protein